MSQTSEIAEKPSSIASEISTTRLGVVSFLNTLPMIDGLESLKDIELKFTVPSCLIDQLLSDEVDMALCSTIDFQKSPEPLVIIPCGILGCDGPTLTVRLYSSIPIHQLEQVYCDTDSHTSIVLLRILLKEIYDIEPEVIDYNAREHVAENKPMEWPKAMLLIGDKVVTDSPPAVRYPHQLDLGAVWANMTELPFVFAAWMAKKTTSLEKLRPAAITLDRQRRANAMCIDRIISKSVDSRHWPDDLARTYLSEYLAYEWTDKRRKGLELFFEMSEKHGLIENLKPVEILSI